MSTAKIERVLDLCEAEDILVASTGVIGVSLDPQVVSRGIIHAASELRPDGGAAAGMCVPPALLIRHGTLYSQKS